LGLELSPAFPHGFISDKCILPADFSVDGWNRFWKEYSYIASYAPLIADRVAESLRNKISKHGVETVIGIDLGLPECEGSKSYFVKTVLNLKFN
jgi:hypothetical protein